MKKSTAMFLAVLVAVVVVFSGVLSACTPNAPHTPSGDSTSKPDGSKPEHVHKLTHIAAVTENCESDGMREHWVCESCGKCFSDGNATKETDADSLVIAAHHTLTHHSEQKATCTADGNVDYYQCAACEKTFLDEAGKNEIALDEVAIAAKGHIVGDEWQYDENGHWKICAACGEKVDYADHNYKEYVCQACGLVDEQNKPMSKQEITEKVIKAVEFNLKEILSIQSTIIDIIALDSDDTTLILLVKNTKKQGNTLAEYLNLITIPMITELTNEILKSDSYKPTSKRAGKSLMTIPLYSQDDRGVEILKKVDPQGDHDHYDFVSVTIGAGALLPGIGATDGIRVYTINSKGISETLICAQSYSLVYGDSYIDDPIGESLLNGEEGKTYEVFRDAYKYFEFSDNVIYDFNGLLPSTETN